MDFGLSIHPSGPGLLCAAAAVVAGAPIFSHGLRALRLRRQFATLREARIAEGPEGLVHVRGRVTLEHSLVGPLSGLPCAAFRLEVRSGKSAAFEPIEQGCDFLLVDGAHSARVLERHARWELQAVEQREIRAEEEISEELTALLARATEAAWARSAGATLHIVERALIEGSECHVVGYARPARSTDGARAFHSEQSAEGEWLRTGTDDVDWMDAGPPVVNGKAHAKAKGGQAIGAGADARATEGSATHNPAPGTKPPGSGDVALAALPADRFRALLENTFPPAEPSLWIGRGEHLEFLLISDEEPHPHHLAPPAWRAAGVAVGPALSLAGLSYLAGALDTLRALGRP